MMSDRPLLAYSVLEEDEGTGGVVFARSSAEARRLGAGAFGDGDFNWGKARRAPWADHVSPGPVPFSVLFAQGWWRECFGCGCRIEIDGCDHDGNEIVFDIVETRGGLVFCTPSCQARQLARDAADDLIRQATIDALVGRLLRAMPGALIAGSPHVYVGRVRGVARAEQAVIEFGFPGAVHALGTFRFDKPGEEPHVTIAHGDRAAFYAWKAAGYPPHMMDGVA